MPRVGPHNRGSIEEGEMLKSRNTIILSDFEKAMITGRKSVTYITGKKYILGSRDSQLGVWKVRDDDFQIENQVNSFICSSKKLLKYLFSPLNRCYYNQYMFQ